MGACGLSRAPTAGCRSTRRACRHSAHRACRRAARRAAGEEAAAQERALQGAVAVDAAAAEAGGLACRVQARDRCAALGQDARGQVGLQATEGLAGEDVQLDGDQRARGGVEDAVRRGGADEPVAEEPAGPATAVTWRSLV